MGILKLESPGLPDRFHIRVISLRQIKGGSAPLPCRGRGAQRSPHLGLPPTQPWTKGKQGRTELQNGLVLAKPL